MIEKYSWIHVLLFSGYNGTQRGSLSDNEETTKFLKPTVYLYCIVWIVIGALEVNEDSASCQGQSIRNLQIVASFIHYYIGALSIWYTMADVLSISIPEHVHALYLIVHILQLLYSRCKHEVEKEHALFVPAKLCAMRPFRACHFIGSFLFTKSAMLCQFRRLHLQILLRRERGNAVAQCTVNINALLHNLYHQITTDSSKWNLEEALYEQMM